MNSCSSVPIYFNLPIFHLRNWSQNFIDLWFIFEKGKAIVSKEKKCEICIVSFNLKETIAYAYCLRLLVARDWKLAFLRCEEKQFLLNVTEEIAWLHEKYEIITTIAFV